jgi:hypothetical protein
MKLTSSPPQIDGRAGGSPQWRHRRDYKARVDTTKGYTPSGAFVVHRETISGTDLDTGEPVDRVILTLSNGETVVADYDANGDEMSRSNRFTPKRATTERKLAKMYDTDLETGLVTEFARVTSVTTEVDGNITYGPAADKTPDLLADYVVAGHADEVPALVRISTENDAVTGSTPYALTVPSQAAYGEIYIEGNNIRWTQDGSTPAPGNGEQERAGTTVKLYGTSALTGFRALPIDNVGNIDPALQADLTCTFWNLNPERGPYSMTVAGGGGGGAPSVSTLLLNYAEGDTTEVNPSLSTFTFAISSPVINGTETVQNANISGFSGGPGPTYSLEQIHTLDLSVLGVSEMSDPVAFTVQNTWVMHLVGTDTSGNFHRMETQIAIGTEVDFADVNSFYSWLIDQFTVLYSDTGLSSPDSLINPGFADGVLSLDATASGMEWDSSGGIPSFERNLSFTSTVYTPATVTNDGNAVGGTWVDVNGNQETFRFDITDPSALNYDEPLIFDFEGVVVDPAITVPTDGSMIVTIDIAETYPPANLFIDVPIISGGDTVVTFEVWYDKANGIRLSDIGDQLDPAMVIPLPLTYSIQRPGTWTINADSLTFTSDSAFNSGQPTFWNLNEISSLGGSTGGATANITVS